MPFIAVYVTHPDHKTAHEIWDQLLAQKAIACYNLFPIESSYWRSGDIEQAHEVVTLLKTRSENRDGLQKLILATHPYDVPCIMKFSIEANPSYEDRIYESTKLFSD